MLQARVEIPVERVAAFCRRNRIRSLQLFGSVLRGDFRDESDVDFLVEFEPGEKVGLLGVARMELELSEIVGRKADLRTVAELSRYFRDDVVRSALVVYSA
ncbi:MAG TPA: nucleotidyltransferase domain-containing protein [Longimicrobiaceae bacterium]|nr:nucleotidyltransferase domain-containing protein [Longimicrobiaceae bacterium]